MSGVTRFQIISWDSGDVESDDTLEYQIRMFGRTKEGQSVACFCAHEPCFYVLMKPQWPTKAVIDGRLQEKLKWRDKHGEMKDLRGHVKDTKIVRRKKFFGFSDDKLFRFCRIVFSSFSALKRAKYLFKDTDIYEANIEPVLRFIHICEIESTGWIEVPSRFIKTSNKETSCDVELRLSSKKDIKAVDDPSICPLVICSFDIEVYSEDGSFPEASSISNHCPVIQIANTYQRFGESKPFKRDLFTLNQCGVIEDTTIIECSSESVLLRKWANSITTVDPDVLVGYNIWKFDLAFIMERAEKLHVAERINLNRLVGTSSEQYKANFSSSAYGDNEYRMVRSIGRMQIDLLEVYKREHKLVKYSLNFVSEHFLKDKKIDMPIKELFSRYKRGTVEDMTEIGKYCVKDTELPLQLMQKLNDIANLMEMAKVTFVPMNYLIERGQQIKVFSQITKETRLNEMLVITPEYGAPRPDSFVGATVLNAEKGAYMNEVVVGLDFASLYPTIMRAHNLCYNTIVLDERYANVEGVVYESIVIGSDEAQRTYKFAQTKQGVLPKILENLAISRKKAKKDMAAAAQRGDTFMKDVFNGKQLAFKVSMNSIYGFCAAFMLPCQPISAAVTTIGRNMIEQTKSHVEEWYPGSHVIYGDTDSVMVIFKTKTEDILRESFALGIEAAEKISKTFKFPIELEFEKCYWPYLLFSKKRYAGLMYTKPEAPDYIDAKGIQLVRRDNPDFVKMVSKKVLNMIMYDRQITEAMAYAMECAEQLLNNQVPIESLILSKSMKSAKSYKACIAAHTENGVRYPEDHSKINLPHFTVMKKMEARSPGSGPKPGDRVPYVFVRTSNPKDLQCAKAEDPQYVKDNNLPLDTLYYLQRSLMSPICSLFELFIDNPEEQMFGEMIRQLQPPKPLKPIKPPISKCEGLTKAGTNCTNNAIDGSSTCKIHGRRIKS